jgi:hypothetical protein
MTNSKHRFEWRDSSIFREYDAQAIGERLELLSSQKGGSPVTAEDVVADAENSKSPFHRMIDWNDESAADKFRKYQARMIVTNVVVTKAVPGNGVQQTRAFVSVRRSEQGAHGYVHVTKTAGFDMVVAARRELESWCRRFAGVDELRPLVEQVYRVLEPALTSARTAPVRKVRVG